MNKIITINLGGIAIQIEEDAYDVLRDYLKSLELHFKGTENSDEILADIENRIAEMLYEKLKVGKVSINTSDINEVAATMGNPSELDADDDEVDSTKKTTASAGRAHKKIKRLFRDTDDRKIGGVCSGVAKYLNVDVTLVRVIWLAMVLLFGSGVFIYILLWAILPEARTAAEKLEMMGEVPNVENIKNTIRDEATQAYKKIRETADSGGFQRIFDKVLALCVSLIQAFLKVFGVFIMIAIAIAIIYFFMRLFTGAHWFDMGSNFRFNLSDINTSLFGFGPYWMVKISWFLVFVIPLMYILVRILISMINAPKPNKLVKQGVFSAWLIAVLLGFGGLVFGVNQIKEELTTVKKQPLVWEGDTLNISISEFNVDGLELHDRHIELDVVQNLNNDAFIEITKGARGRNSEDAENGINSIAESFKLNGKTMLLNDRILSGKKPKTKMPTLRYTLHIPVGKFVYFNANTRKVLSDIDNTQNVLDWDMAGNVFLMTSGGLSCTSCSNSIEQHYNVEPSNSVDVIEHIDISDAVRVEIIEDGTDHIVYPKDKKWRESLDVELKSNKLIIRRKSDHAFILDWLNNEVDVKIEIHTSNLKSLEVDGSSTVIYTANANTTKEYFSLEAGGANSVEIKKLNAFKFSADIAGSNKLTIAGKVNIFLLESDGASTTRAFELSTQTTNVDVAGAAVCEIQADVEISGKVEGASSLKYRGNPKVSVRSKGVSVVKQDH